MITSSTGIQNNFHKKKEKKKKPSYFAAKDQIPLSIIIELTGS